MRRLMPYKLNIRLQHIRGDFVALLIFTLPGAEMFWLSDAHILFVLLFWNNTSLNNSHDNLHSSTPRSANTQYAQNSQTD